MLDVEFIPTDKSPPKKLLDNFFTFLYNNHNVKYKGTEQATEGVSYFDAFGRGVLLG